jgi:hypothetical protein
MLKRTIHSNVGGAECPGARTSRSRFPCFFRKRERPARAPGRKSYPWTVIQILSILSACIAARAAFTNELVIEAAAPPPNVQLGFGWLQPERGDDYSFVWIDHMEADLWVTLDSASAADIEIRAVPYYVADRRQNIGLYVNERFIAEWICPDHMPWLLDSYTARIPEGVLKPGRNRLILRMGYRAGSQDQEYALAVNRIILRGLDGTPK